MVISVDVLIVFLVSVGIFFLCKQIDGRMIYEVRVVFIIDSFLVKVRVFGDVEQNSCNLLFYVSWYVVFKFWIMMVEL